MSPVPAEHTADLGSFTAGVSTLLRENGALPAGTVVSLAGSPLSRAGRYGVVYRLRPRYSDDTTGRPPAALILKRRAAALDENRYAEEHGFYRAEEALYGAAAAVTTGMRLPHFWGALPDTAGFGLLLEDLGQSHAQADRAAGLSPAEAVQIVDWMACLHKNWTGRTDDLPEPLRGSLPAVEEAALRRFTREAAPHLDDEALRLCEAVYARFRDLRDLSIDRQATLCHGDLHTMNLFFPRPGTGELATAVDWQRSGVGSGLLDLAGFLCFTLHPLTRRRLDRELLARYQARAGVPAGIDDLRLALALCLAEPAGMLDRGHAIGFAVMCTEKVVLACRALGVSPSWIRSLNAV